jgi:hypothetical protein
MRFGFLLRNILNKDVLGQEPRQPFGRVIVNKASLSYVSLLSPSFNRLPHNRLDGDTRIGHAGSTQKQTFGSCANCNTPITSSTQVPQTVLTFHPFRSKLHPDIATSASHIDPQESLRALQESADAFPNPHLKRAVSGVSTLWQIAKVEQFVGSLQRYMFYHIS